MNIYQFLHKLGININNKELIKTALTHSSYVNEHRLVNSDNERLEFMGDAVLQMWSAHTLYATTPILSEGEMTMLRAQVVCGKSLAQYCLTNGINKFIRLGVGEEKTGGRERESILADAFEALLGAIYLDQGYLVAARFLDIIVKPTIHQPKAEVLVDFKTKLQECVQADSRKIIRYEMLSMEGPSNQPTFEMAVYLDEIMLGKGIGSSKKKAEQNAAKDALEKLVTNE